MPDCPSPNEEFLLAISYLPSYFYCYQNTLQLRLSTS
jgi:hypothetical protein